MDTSWYLADVLLYLQTALMLMQVADAFPVQLAMLSATTSVLLQILTAKPLTAKQDVPYAKLDFT